jgi:glucan biosynthesis protein
MSDTFNDGDPIDAATLQRLKTEVAKATALAGAKVSAGSNIDIKNLTEKEVADFVPPRFFGGVTAEKTITTAGGGTEFVINYEGAGFQKVPDAIILTPIAENNKESMYSASIIKGSVSKTGARAQIRAYSASKKVSLYFLAIQNQS